MPVINLPSHTSSSAVLVSRNAVPGADTSGSVNISPLLGFSVSALSSHGVSRTNTGESEAANALRSPAVRRDAPAIAIAGRGSRGDAYAAIASLGERRKAENDFCLDISANSSRASLDSLWGK